MSPSKTINIPVGPKTLRIGAGHPCFVIAEAGVNHNGDPALARRLIDAAADSGADAVKFQTFVPEQVVAPAAETAAYQARNTGRTESQLDLLSRCCLPREAYLELRDHARQRDLVFLSTGFDADSVDFLAGMDVPLFKIPSGEVTNLPLLRHVAAKERPIILSTGLATLGEVETAVRALESGGCRELVILHCVTNYPAAPAEANLSAMATLRRAFDRPVGYSDHHAGTAVAIAAVALGAVAIEKHFTLDRSLPGPDHAASLEPVELRAMIGAIRNVESARGDGIKAPGASELRNRDLVRRSLHAARDLPAGHRLTADDLICLRPARGIPPGDRDMIVGRRLRRAVRKGEALPWESIGAAD